MQIDKIKYRKGLKLFQANQDRPVATINQLLQSIDFSQREIDAFWQSSLLLKSFLKSEETYLSLLHYDEEEIFFENDL